MSWLSKLEGAPAYCCAAVMVGLMGFSVTYSSYCLDEAVSMASAACCLGVLLRHKHTKAQRSLYTSVLSLDAGPLQVC